MDFSMADGLVENRFLDMLNEDAAQEPVLLRLRASSRSWRELCRPRLLADCAARLASKDPSARLAALCILGTAGGEEASGRGITIEEARAAASQGLGDSDPDVRRLAVRTLAHLVDRGDAEAFKRIALHVQRDRAWPVRWAAVDAMVHVAAGSDCSARAAELLAERLEDKDWPVRRAAMGGLVKVEEPGNVLSLVMPRLHDEQEDVRIAVVRILAQLCSPGDRTAISRAMVAEPKGASSGLRCFLVLAQAVLYVGLLRLRRFNGPSTTPWCNVEYKEVDCGSGKAFQNNMTSGLKVVMPSYGQTGTTSLIMALREMGLRSFHADDFSILAKPVMFDKVALPLFAAAVSRCRMDAISLEPTVDLLPVVLATSPDAKVIMTWRTFPSWLKSTSNFQKRDKTGPKITGYIAASNDVFPWVVAWDRIFGTIKAARWEGAPFHQSSRLWSAYMYRATCNGYVWPITDVKDRGTYRSHGSEEAYLAHVNEIRTSVPAGRLLEFDVKKHGWAELESFLGLKSGRAGTPFPRPRTSEMRTNEPLMENYLHISVPVYFALLACHALNWLLVGLALQLLLLACMGCRPARLEGVHERWARALRRSPVVIVLDGLSAADAVPMGRALAEAGVRLILVALRGEEALECIRLLSQALPTEVLVGASSVASSPSVRKVREAGGVLILCPHVDAGVVQEAAALGVVAVTGACTPTETALSIKLGADAVAVCQGEQLTPEGFRCYRSAAPGEAMLLALPQVLAGEAVGELQAAGAGLLGTSFRLDKLSDAPATVAGRARELVVACAAFRPAAAATAS